MGRGICSTLFNLTLAFNQYSCYLLNQVVNFHNYSLSIGCFLTIS
jgi:hypothetical protein